MKWYEMPIVVIDLETTGFRSPSGVIEIGAVRYESGEEIDRLELLVRPEVPIEAGATKVHGLAEEDVKDQPFFCERYPQLAEFLKSAIPVSYGNYDRRMLHEELARLPEVDTRVPAFSREWGPWFDVLEWARRLHPGPRRKGLHTLQTMTAKYGIENAKAHRAVHDAAATGELLWLWRDRLPDLPISELLLEQ